MKSIEDQIREKKAELKEANRALSKLQDELKKKNEPQWYRAFSSSTDGLPLEAKDGIHLWVASNKGVDRDKLISAIESLSETPSEPKSYVDWEKINIKFNYVGVDSSGRISAYKKKPRKNRNMWICAKGDHWAFDYVPDVAIIRPPPSWDKSLIHRPGAKE